MKINWDRWLQNNRSRFLWGSCVCILSAFALFYLDYTKPRVNNKDDLIYVSSPFVSYSWVKYTKGSSLTFKLQKFNDNFKIKADYFKILKQNEFEHISPGKIINIGIIKSHAKYLNTAKDPFFVYTITGENETYLDFEDVIKVHNSNLFIVFSIILLSMGILYIFLFYKSKSLAK